MAREISSIKMGEHVVEIPGDIYVHIEGNIKTTTISKDGCIEILDHRPLVLRFEDGDYWLDLKDLSVVERAAQYLNDQWPGKEPVARVPYDKQWAVSDEEDGSIEFYTDEELIALATDYEKHN